MSEFVHESVLAAREAVETAMAEVMRIWLAEMEGKWFVDGGVKASRLGAERALDAALAAGCLLPEQLKQVEITVSVTGEAFVWIDEQLVNIDDLDRPVFILKGANE